jgi:hypothetical protein
VIVIEVPDGGDTKTEQLWARHVEHRFEPWAGLAIIVWGLIVALTFWG